MNLKVENCPQCGSVFQKNLRNLCSACSTKLDTDLNDCVNYLWKFPKTTTEELSKAVDVEVSRISAFIKEGRISKNFHNLTYPCECCGTQIREYRLCSGFRQIAKLNNPDKKREPMGGYNIKQRLKRN
jgi:hypothetical protein